MSDATFELDSLIKATAVGTVTMVAFYGEFPMESGNCFSVRSEDGKYRQVLNFGHENFEELLARKVISYPVEILPMSDGHCLMADHRIPKEWYNNEFCSSCTPNDLLPPQQKLERLLDLKSGRRKETEIDLGDGSKGVLVSHESKMPSGYIYAPWTVSTSASNTSYRPNTATSPSIPNSTANFIYPT